VSERPGDELAPTGSTEFAVEVLHMVVDGVRGAIDDLGDDSDGIAFDEVVENGLFSLGEPGDLAGGVYSDCGACFVCECGQGSRESRGVNRAILD